MSSAACAAEGSEPTPAVDIALTVDCAAAMRLSKAPSSFLLCCPAVSLPFVYVEATDCADGAVDGDPDPAPRAAATRKLTAEVWSCGQLRTARYQPGAKAMGTPTVRPP